MRSTNQGEILTALSLCKLLHETYWPGAGADEFVVDMLTHLRHFCDARNLPSDSLDQRAYQHYRNEKAHSGESQEPKAEPPTLYLHVPANAFTSMSGTTGRHWLQARVSADGVQHSLWAISVTGGLGKPSAVTQDLGLILCIVRSLTGGTGRLRTVRLFGEEYVLLLAPSKEP